MFSRMITLIILTAVLATGILLAGCGNGEEKKPPPNKEEVKIVTTISILADIADNIVGDRGTVEYLVPKGQHPEEYEPRPSDFQKISDADLLLANGLGLEEWLVNISSEISDTEIVYLTKGGPTIPLVGQDGEDPHLWFNVQNVINYYVKNTVDALVKADPENKSEYRENASIYTTQLQNLENWIKEKVTQIDPEDRVIVVSENAFKYFGKAYGFDTEGIWELNSHQEGTPQQISRVVDLVKEREVRALFVETTVDKKFMNTVSKDTGVPIAGEVYTDAVGIEGSGANTYIDMMKHNVNRFVKGLGV